MEPIKKPSLKDKDMNDRFSQIYNNAVGIPLILKAVPTSDTMRANTMAFFDDDLYVKFQNGTLLKFTGAVIS